MIDQKTRTVILVICLLVTLVFTAVFGILKTKYAAYSTVDATIVETYTKTGTGKKSSSKSHFVVYEYQADGETYTAKQQVFSKMGHREGRVETIRYDPQDPAVIENQLLVSTIGFFAGFLALFTVLLWFVIRKGTR